MLRLLPLALLAVAAAEPQWMIPSTIQSNGLVKHWNGAVTPMETPAVAMAKANHLAAKGAFIPYTGIHMIGKREAEPQWINSPFFSSFAGYNLVLPYNTYSNILSLGKREAEEEKKAEEEPMKVLPAMTYGMPWAYNTMPLAYNAMPLTYAAMPVAKPMVAHWNGAVVPMDTAEVAKAKMEHFEAKVEEYKKNPELKKMVYTAPLITKLWKREAEEKKEDAITYAGLPVETADAWIKKADGMTTYKMPITYASTYGMPLATSLIKPAMTTYIKPAMTTSYITSRTVMPSIMGYNNLFI
jgi:hypothetical protein